MTVKIHRGHVMRKMHAGSLPELVRVADGLGESAATSWAIYNKVVARQEQELRVVPGSSSSRRKIPPTAIRSQPLGLRILRA
jgi:hypothetical protein